jgi:hypothetical protein
VAGFVQGVGWWFMQFDFIIYIFIYINV